MWTHKAWPGRFVPRSLPAGERLRAYAEWCDAVEGNATFYAIPTRETAASWARQTSPDFRFVVKFPRTVTVDTVRHHHLLRHSADQRRRTGSVVAGAGRADDAVLKVRITPA